MTQLQLRFSMRAIALVLFLCCIGATFGLAQTNAGTVVGTVTDQSGAVVPDATVTLTDPSTNDTRTTVSGHTGQYAFVNVAPGNYIITASKSGFELNKIANQTVQVGTQTTANFKLHVGSAQQTVEVQAAGTDLQTLNATVGSTVEQEAIAELPSLLHDAGTFTTLQVGVSPDGSVAGTVVDQSTFSLDGGNNTNDMDGSMSVYTGSFAGDPTGIANQNRNVAAGATGVMPTPQDSVEEFKVNATNQTADFNNSAGAQVEVVTKRGTNRWHGTGYEYYLDNNFSANTWDNNSHGVGDSYAPPPSFHYSKFGGGGGGPILPHFMGGKTYLFALYQGYRYPNSTIYKRAVPSPNLKNGLITFGGTTYNLADIDPRHIGINPIVQQMWNKYEPDGAAGCPAFVSETCDGVNQYEFKGNLNLPTKDNFLVGRLDHDFSDRWHFMTSYRYYKLTQASTSQIDIGGFFTGDKLGQATSVASRPQQPWYYVAGLTTNITSSLTNDFHFSYLRNYWSWADENAPPQISGLGGALEPGGETATPLAPFNVNTQSVRTRFWDGQDQFYRDDLTLVKGNHLITFGGQYQHNFNFHQRSDNGGGINFTPTYQLGSSGGTGAGSVDLSDLSGGYPTTRGANRLAAEALGIVTAAQVAYTRSGPTLALNPPLTHAFDQSTIPYYNVYFSDTWHMKPSFTLSYGLGWTLEMPPTEASGKQTVLVDSADEPVKTLDYLAQKKAAALKGQVYNPELGFALVGNVGKGSKYPYNPFYGSFSPRVGVAWNPRFAGDGLGSKLFGHEGTVIRGGYARVYGRLNGVDLVLVPLLGVGLIQPVQCTQALATGACGPDNPTATTAFRIGVDGNSAPLAAASPTLPQPVYPGYNNGESSAAEGLDPDFRPNVSDTFDFTIQRQINRQNTLEVGYIGRRIQHEYQPYNLNVVPYMMVSGGQDFKSAYAALETALGCAKSAAACGAAGVPSGVPAQPFFESSLAASGYCTGYANCTAAVVAKEFDNLTSQSVWGLWSDLDGGNFNFGAPTMQNNGTATHPAIASSGLALNASTGYGNYNGLFLTLTTQNFHGLLMHNNFTYSKALGTGAFVQATSEYTPNDAFDLSKMYGQQAFNRKFVYNSYMVWQEPFYKGQQGILGRVVGGWSLAPIFTAGSGEPLYCDTISDGQSFGSADANNYFTNEQCVFTSKYTGGNSSHYNVAGSNGVGTATAGSGSRAVNMFKDPEAVWNQVRAPILGIDSKNPGVGPISGTPYWNVDMSVEKSVKVYESVALKFSVIFTNVFNHNVLGDPAMNLGDSTTWGVQSGQTNIPRKMEFGMRASF
ncbi:MAG TPA: carboxypeptidase-like regulatory domain-containing protein [Terracidiphilus sp.]|nr:carboxypeptidase-like regulatory domain-containing protein [Terracidiphilus sp.]